MIFYTNPYTLYQMYLKIYCTIFSKVSLPEINLLWKTMSHGHLKTHAG